jgi:hypothetical protein
MIYSLWSAWVPDLDWLETILKKYEYFLIKNDCDEEG